MSACIKIGSQDLTKSLLKLMETLAGFQQASLQALNACSGVYNPRWEKLFVRQGGLLSLLSEGIVLVAVEKAQGNGRVHGKK